MFQLLRRFINLSLLTLVVVTAVQAATLSQNLAAKLTGAADAAEVGVVIIAFNTNNGLSTAHLDTLRAAGITKGITLQQLGMVATPATAAQVRALAGHAAVRSIWSNDPLYYYMHQARILAGVDRLRTDAAFTKANGGMPVSGAGDFSVVVNDSGIDATHKDLQFGNHVVQNVQILTDTDTLAGFTPLLTAEGVVNTDTHVGHGTHCAGIVGATGQQSGGRYQGVAPGAKLIGTGSGAGLFILNALGGFEWSMANQFLYNIRIITNSWGSSGPFNPDNPINVASHKAVFEHNMVVLFAAGNDGPGWDTHNPYAKAPWVISVGAGTKEGGLASFSSKGIPKEERLNNGDPNDDSDAPSLVAPGTGREFESNSAKFTSDIVSTRSTSNVASNGLTADVEIPPAYLPFYTQISGTSMATPFAAGVAALLLDVDPTLSAAEVKQILQQTASRMPGFEEFEVGAGYINAYAAVDKAINRGKNYGTFVTPSFNAQLTTTWSGPDNFSINYVPQPPGPTSTNTYRFEVRAEDNIGLLNAVINFGTNAVTDELGNSMGLVLYPPGCQEVACGYNSGLTLPVLDSPRRQVVVRFPKPGQWVAEVRGLRGLTLLPVSSPVGIAVPERVDGVIKQATVSLQNVPDIAGHPAESQIRNALLTRQMDIMSNGKFQPDTEVRRKDFARHLAFNTPLRQTLGLTPKFTDVSGDLVAIAEAVTAHGSTLRDWNFTPEGMMSASGTNFKPNDRLTRLDLAVALVRALGLDAEAKAMAGQPVIVNYNGQVLTLTDNAEIPAALRGYVQLALDKQILQAFFTLEQGPFDFQPTLKARVKPNDTTTRAFLAFALANYRQHFIAGN